MYDPTCCACSLPDSVATATTNETAAARPEGPSQAQQHPFARLPSLCASIASPRKRRTAPPVATRRRVCVCSRQLRNQPARVATWPPALTGDPPAWRRTLDPASWGIWPENGHKQAPSWPFHRVDQRCRLLCSRGHHKWPRRHSRWPLKQDTGVHGSWQSRRRPVRCRPYGLAIEAKFPEHHAREWSVREGANALFASDLRQRSGASDALWRLEHREQRPCSSNSYWSQWGSNPPTQWGLLLTMPFLPDKSVLTSWSCPTSSPPIWSPSGDVEYHRIQELPRMEMPLKRGS